jgi:hypothetical protein
MEPFNSDKIVEKEIIKLKELFNIKAVVETGTYFGVTTKFFCENFDLVYGIELNDNYANKTRDLCRDHNNLNLVIDSSVNFLNNELKSLGEKFETILFYLDAHWDDYWPLIDEIKAISKNYYDKAIIVIDDFYVPNRNFQYDTYHNQICNYDYIVNDLNNCYSDYSYYYLNNSLRNLPKRDGQNGGVGKLYVIPNSLIKNKNIKNEDLFMIENNYNYSILI